jgi:gliding motility-associated-like protein
MGALYVLSNISGLKAPHVRGRMVMLAVLLLWVGAIHPDQAQCQAYPISNGTVNTCIGAFLDSGGEGGAGYGNNENFTYTICPDNANDAVSLTFLTFQLNNTGPAPADQMTIHDGNSTVAPTLGTYAGNALEGYVVNASPLNTSGCLTIVFRSNAAGTGIFAASITCYTPCQRPTAVATMSEAAPAKVCPGEAITFNSTGSFAAPGFTIANRRWEWGDGTVTDPAPAVTTHTYAQPGYYQAQLYLVDDNGCASTNRVDLEVFVGTAPTFNGTGGDILGCVGETLCLDAVVNPVTFNEVPTGDLGNGVFLPDQVGSCFTAEIEFTQFDPGQTLTSVADLLSICMNMEHSFIGDLVVRIISPTGQTVTMHQQGGGATFLGIPVDNDAQPNAQGTCWQYCFSPTATNGTWVDNMGVTLPSGTYESLNPLNGLVGSQLNGIWQLQICDLWASDNGFVCDWNITFDPDLFPDLVEFTPVYGTDCDSSSWSGPGITSTTGDCQGICMTPSAPGVFPYTYTVTDDFGCGYDTTLSITVIPPATISAGADVSTCNTPVPLNATITTGGFPSNCVYQLILNDSFGDGWTLGSSVTVTVNGVPTTHTLLLGSTTTINIPVTNGATVILNYTAALLWNGEQSYTLLNSTGGTVYASPLGPISGNPWSGPAVCPAGGFVYSWSPATGLSNPNIANPIATVTSTTTYCVTAYQTGHPACPATDCVTITVDNAVDPGTDGSVAVCADGAPISLFGQLGGTPNTGGTWIAPNAAAHSGTFIPGADPAGVYTYTVTGTGACGSSSATSTVTVAVASVADAGTNSALTVCSMDGPLDLFATLGGAPQTGGVWTGPSAVVGGQFDPATMSAGAYTYTVTGTAPCPDATATVSVTINTPPDPGTDGAITLCTSDAAVDLFAQLGGTPDAGGVWTGPSAVVGGQFDPATMSAGAYTYTVTGTAPCPNASAIVTVTINMPPNAGVGGTITLCSSDAPAALFGQLGGTPDPGGTWSGPSAVNAGMIDPATMSAGVYTYTVTGTAPCPDATATVSVTINTPPDPGTDGAIALCVTSPTSSLFNALGGNPDQGGTWSGPSVLNGDLFDPATMTPGVFTYTLTGTVPCPSASSEVTVNVVSNPDPGTPSAVTLCTSDGVVDLFGLLGGTPDPGGSWSGPSTLSNGQFDPATMVSGSYTYTIAVPPPCVSVSSTVSVNLVQAPDAGTNGNLLLCISSPSTPLLPALGGSPDAGGTWSGPSPVNGGLFDPATMSAGAYTYTVAGTTPCPASSADVLVAVATTPDAGTPGGITVCASDATLDLFNQLGGTPDPGGSWTGPSTVVAGLFDPATMNAGVYTYTIDVPPPCVDVSSTVTVVVVQPPTAGSDGSMTLCISSPSTPLLPALGGSPDAGGTWSGPSPVNGGLFDPATMSAGIYTYAVSGIAPCPAAFATVEVNVVNEPDPGGPGFLTACATGDVVDLFTRIEGTPDAGGVWSGPSALTDGSFNPAIHTAGEYTYTLNVPPPCTSASTTVTVDVVQPPDAGADASVTVCASGTVMDLYGILGGDPDPGGSWTIDGSVPASASFDPTADLPGTFQYTVFGEIPCPNDVASVTVNITEEPFAGNDAILNLCISGDPVNVFNSLSGAETGGTWIAPGGGPFNGTFVPGTSLPGEYIYQVLGMAPCPSDSARVSITQLTDPNAGGDASITLCSTGLPLDLFSQLQGNPDPGGIWLNSNQVVIGAAYDPSTQPTDDLYYVLAVPPPCVSDTAHLEVTIIQASDAGEDTTTTICTASGDLDLFATLGGVPDPGGNWIGPQGATDGIFSPVQDPSGAYTYTILATTPCPTVMATVTVAVEAPPNAGVDGGATLCPDAAPINLFSLLGGTPASTGSWTDPGGSLTSGTFDPAMDQPGLYTYTVFGTLCPNDVATASVAIWFVPSPYAGEDEVTCTLDHELMAIGDWAYGAWTGPPGSTVASPASSTTPVSVTTGGAFTFHWNSVTEEGCTNVDSVTIIFTRPLEGIATTTDAICHDACDGTAHVLATGGNGDLSYTWSVPSIGDTATATGLCAGQYTVNVADTNACALSLPMLIGEPAPLTIDGISTTPETCPGSCDGILVVADPDGVSYILSGNSQTDPTFNSLCPGIHTVMMIDANGCTAEMEGLITSPPPVIPSFTYSPDTILANGTEVHFANLSSPNAVTFNWVFGDGDTSPIEQPVHSYPQGLGGVYEVCLVATDLNGCRDTVCAPLIIHDLLAVHVPNAFTPNGDGVNDVFLPVLNVPRVKDYQFMVFNRWGELIFGTERPGEPWDGAYQGVVSQVDVYVWRLTCKDALSGDLIEKVGHVSIVR